jgi:RNA polymerase sigma-70 factor (ECF subfamily)
MSLLARLRQPKDDAAWTRFVHLYTPLLYSWATRTGLQDSDAADLVQEVFAHLLRKLPEFQYDPALRFRAWLRTVTMNLWRDRHRRRRAPEPAGDALPEPVAPDSLAALIDREYRDRLVQRAMQLMQADFQPATWQACWQVVVDGRSADDVGQALGLSVGAVYAAKFRVLTRLRQELEGLMEE